MKLGVFDSGLGGLIITKAIRKVLPDIDILYYGDTLHLPYGNRSQAAIYQYTKASMDFMFEQGCQLIVMACNTASAAALRQLQQTWLQDAWPGRNIIGVVVPTLETAIEAGHKRLGLIGTNYIVNSDIYRDELQKLNPAISLHSIATPLLVPLLENKGERWEEDVLRHYLEQFSAHDIECLMLGCTHYALLKPAVEKILGQGFPVLSQDEIIPGKLALYLSNHPEYADPIHKNGKNTFLVSDLTDSYIHAAHRLYGAEINVEKAQIS